MYEHVKTGCKHIPPSEQPLQFQSLYFFNEPRIYHYLPPTFLGVSYTIFSETIVLLAQKPYSFCNVVTKVELHNVKYTLPFKLIVLLQCLKQYKYIFYSSVSYKF